MNTLAAHLNELNLGDWSEHINFLSTQKLAIKHGDLPRWRQALSKLPTVNNYQVNLSDEVKLTTHEQLDTKQLEQTLQTLCPWRKGPFHLFGIDIDSEWQSNLKWQRLAKHINLTDKRILDVGCGNGYYGFRMLGSGAKSVIGIEPNLLFYHQFLAFKHYLNDLPIWILPLTLEQINPPTIGFDTVFSMGVLYHRSDPIGHLQNLRAFMTEQSELVLETLIIDGDENSVLMPKDRYAQMRNVWFIPSILMLEIWLKRVGFKNIRLVDISTTSTTEQRVTNWMQFQSLADFLHPHNHNLTIENLPAPKRAIFLANK